ncbi:MAG: hypothetical protein NTW27_14925 [Deltaproteobacteria bacterium]|nr:hypothetical protein [Deltaproteobacteria bacterium]
MNRQSNNPSNAWQCPKCRESLPVRYDECPRCGIIVEKLFRKDLRDGLDDQSLITRYGLAEEELEEWKKSVPTHTVAPR